VKGVWLCWRRQRVLCLVQWQVTPTPALSTSSTWGQELGSTARLSLGGLEVIL